MRSCPTLPEEILFDILSRLPAKSVGQCRCVSTSWRSLLSQPQFIRKQIHRSKVLQQESSMLLFRHVYSFWYACFNDAHQVFDKITLSLKKLNFAEHPDSWFKCHGSCDGLVLVADDKGKMFVFNPVTREIRELPISAFTGKPRVTLTKCGLGYDPVSDDYKIAALPHCIPDDGHGFFSATEASVYSLKTGSFTSVESFSQRYDISRREFGVFVGGCINWFAKKLDEGFSFEPVILAFNIVEHKFSEVPLPKSAVDDNLEFDDCGVCGGCLCIYDQIRCDIWVMSEYGVQESWAKFNIDSQCRPSRVMCYLNQEQVLVQKNMCCVVYDMKKGTSKEMELKGISDCYYSVQSFPESLISPHGLW